MKHFQAFATLFFAVAFSAWLGRADLHTDDTGILVGLIAVGGFVLAMLEPARPWIWGLIVPAGIIGVECVRYKGGAGLAAIAGLTIGVACAAAYFGAFLRVRMGSHS